MRSLVLLPRVDLFGSVLCPYRPMCQPSSCASLIFSRRPSLRLPRTGRCGGSTVTRPASDRKSDVEGKSVSVRVDLGGRWIILKKSIAHLLHSQITNHIAHYNNYKYL